MMFLEVCAGIALIIVALAFGCYLIAVKMPPVAIEPPTPDRPQAFLVLDAELGPVAGTTVGARAMEYAENLHGVVALVPLSADFRTRIDLDG